MDARDRANAVTTEADEKRSGAGPRGPTFALAATPVTARVQRVIDRIACGFVFERSVKVTPAGIDDARFLVSIDTAELKDLGAETLVSIGAELGAPAAATRALIAGDPALAAVHLGIEGAAAPRAKLYAEYALSPGHMPTPDRPKLVHLALKGHPGGVWQESRYLWRGPADRQTLRRQLLADLDPAPPPLSAVMAAVLETACRRVDARELMLLQVSESGTRRRSVDLNVYDAGLTVADIAPALRAAAQIVDLPAATVSGLIAQLVRQPIGHLAAGVGPHGDPFVTVYHGARACPAGANLP